MANGTLFAPDDHDRHLNSNNILKAKPHLSALAESLKSLGFGSNTRSKFTFSIPLRKERKKCCIIREFYDIVFRLLTCDRHLCFVVSGFVAQHLFAVMLDAIVTGMLVSLCSNICLYTRTSL